MAGGRYDPGVTKPGWPALFLDRLEAVVFDTDGVLTDTASVHAAAWKRLFDQYLRRRATRDAVCGLGNAKDRFFLAHLCEHGATPFPTSVAFVRRLRAEGQRTAVVSASRNMVAVLSSAGLRELFDVEVDGVEAARLGLAGKPDPALFLEAARRLGVTPDRAAVVEDALAGVEAGRRGRFRVVVGVDRGGQAAALAERGADLVVADLEELALDGGPVRRGAR